MRAHRTSNASAYIHPDPWERRGAFLDGETLDLVSVDDEEVVLGEIGRGFLAGDGFLRLALRGVVFHEVGEVVSGNEIVHGDDIDFFAQETLVADGAKDEAADATETIDANFDHSDEMLIRCRCSLVVKTARY